MDQDEALNDLGTALVQLLESQLEKGSPALQLAMAEVVVAHGGQVRIEIELPALRVVCSIQPGENAEVKELFKIEPGRRFRPGEN